MDIKGICFVLLRVYKREIAIGLYLSFYGGFNIRVILLRQMTELLSVAQPPLSHKAETSCVEGQKSEKKMR